MKASAVAPEIDELPPVMRSNPLRVLLVDGDSESLAATSSWFDQAPHVKIFAFSSAEEALTQSTGDSYDLCLLDNFLNGVNGVMLGAMIRALNPGARMLLMSEVLNARVERSALEHGFEAVIAKPIVREQLEHVLGRDGIGAVRQ